MGYAQKNASPNNALMPDLVLISSGVMHDYGVFDQSQRFIQLCQSVQSVYNTLQTCDVIVIEASRIEMPKYQRQILHDIGAQFYQIDLDPQTITSVQSDANQFCAKIVGEIKILTWFFEELRINYFKYRRIHKLSGRYQMTNLYREHNLDTVSMLLRPSQIWGTGPLLGNAVEKIYPTRLWSFHTDLYTAVRQMWQHIFRQHTQLLADFNMYRIIEAHMYEGINAVRLPCNEVDPIGVQGWFGQNGAFITE